MIMTAVAGKFVLFVFEKPQGTEDLSETDIKSQGLCQSQL